ncbi:MAG: N-acetylglucosamine-6-phosphate deacetylase [Alphaproteobacteria bacterium]|nr:N-acetylglucosamine-6-phosphate deacetylase [Alphaproteobacteria bacterium]
MRQDAAVLVRDGEIVDVIGPAALPDAAERCALPDGAILVPGFIDVQVNGGGGILLNDLPSAEAMAAIARVHRRFGTTACLPTLITDRRQTMMDAIAAAERAVTWPGVLGIHLEGPFLNPARKGIHRADLMVRPRLDDLDLLGALGRIGCKMITLAPERAPPGFIRALAERGVRVSAGHSDATADEMATAADQGLTGVTHLFNAMSPLTARAPGLVGAALADRRLFAGLICDGLHVDAVTMRVAHRAKGTERLMLVTDAMPSIGTGADRFTLMGQEIRLDNGRLTSVNGTLAGAHLDMAGAVRNAVRLLGIDLSDALAMASRTPAVFLGVDRRYGRVARGYNADLVALTAALDVIGTWIAGAFEPA